MSLPLTPALVEPALQARTALTSEAQEQLAAYIYSQGHTDGGFCDRAGQQDLYYTVFGLSACSVLGIYNDVADATQNYISTMLQIPQRGLLDLVCMARCCCLINWMSHATRAGNDPQDTSTANIHGKSSNQQTFNSAASPLPYSQSSYNTLLSRIEALRGKNGGYKEHPASSAEEDTYSTFLAVQAYRDVGKTPPAATDLLANLERFRTSDGGFANTPGQSTGTTTTTAAAAVLYAQLAEKVDTSKAWLLARATDGGGFTAAPGNSHPDMLSTASTLYALKTMHVYLPADMVADCYKFVEAIWREGSGFCYSLLDTQPDCEFTFYGLLSLGCLVQIEKAAE